MQYLVLFAHNDTGTDFSYWLTDTFQQDEGNSERGDFPSAESFRKTVEMNVGDLSQFTVIDLLEEGKASLDYSHSELEMLAKAIMKREAKKHMP